MWYVYVMKYYSALKKNEIMSFTEKWMELLSEISQIQKDKYHVFFHVQNLDLKKKKKKERS
jgi:hypothetical protein